MFWNQKILYFNISTGMLCMKENKNTIINQMPIMLKNMHFLQKKIHNSVIFFIQSFKPDIFWKIQRNIANHLSYCY